jgi:hypothetical protein
VSNGSRGAVHRRIVSERAGSRMAASKAINTATTGAIR